MMAAILRRCTLHFTSLTTLTLLRMPGMPHAHTEITNSSTHTLPSSQAPADPALTDPPPSVTVQNTDHTRAARAAFSSSRSVAYSSYSSMTGPQSLRLRGLRPYCSSKSIS